MATLTHTLFLELLPRTNTIQSTPRSMAVTSKSLHRTLVASTILVFPAIVYAVTLYCAATSTYRYSPLGLVSPKHGILILNILSKAGDVALATAADSAWSAIKFMVTFRRSPTSLSTVFALSSGIGWLGLTGIMTQRRVFRALDQRTWAFLRYVRRHEHRSV